MSDPTVKFFLDHPQKVLLIFQESGTAGRFGLVKPGHPPKFSPICLFLEGTFKIVIDIAKKESTDFFEQYNCHDQILKANVKLGYFNERKVETQFSGNRLQNLQGVPNMSDI